MIKQLKNQTDDLEESGTSVATAFSYKFKDDLKLQGQSKTKSTLSDSDDFDRHSEKSIGDIDIQDV